MQVKIYEHFNYTKIKFWEKEWNWRLYLFKLFSNDKKAQFCFLNFNTLWFDLMIKVEWFKEKEKNIIAWEIGICIYYLHS